MSNSAFDPFSTRIPIHEDMGESERHAKYDAPFGTDRDLRNYSLQAKALQKIWWECCKYSGPELAERVKALVTKCERDCL